MHEQIAYTATLVTKDDDLNYIDIRPPINPAQEYLDWCGDQYQTDMRHIVTTPKTTRLEVSHRNEDQFPSREQLSRFQRTAEFIVYSLQAIDAGNDIENAL